MRTEGAMSAEKGRFFVGLVKLLTPLDHTTTIQLMIIRGFVGSVCMLRPVGRSQAGKK